MPWRLIVVVLLMGILIAFIGLNLENRADISFGFYRYEQVPIFISLFVSFIAGVVVMLPFTIGRRRKRKKAEKEATQNSESGEKQLEKPKKRRGFRKIGSKEPNLGAESESSPAEKNQ